MSGIRAPAGRAGLAVAIWAVSVASCLAALMILVATRGTEVPSSWGFRGASEAFGLSCATIGLVVAVRRPDNLNGWLFCAIGILFSAEALVNEYVIAGALVVPGGLPLTTGLAWSLTWLWVLPFSLAVIFLPLVFPTGRLLSARWRTVAGFAVVASVAFGVVSAFEPGPIRQATFLGNPLGVTRVSTQTWGSLVIGPTALLLLGAIVLAMASVVVRFRRAPLETRLQIKWFALAVFIVGVTFTVYVSVMLITLSALTVKLLEVLVVASLPLVPLSAGLAILRYRLYDIDRIISRTIGYAIVTGVLGATFVVLILVLQAVLTQITGGQTIAVAASTLVVFALFQPVMRAVRRAVDHRFDRARYDAERTTTAFSERLRAEVDMETITTDLRGTVGEAIAPTSLAILLRAGRTNR